MQSSTTTNDTVSWGTHRGQHTWSSMDEPHPGKITFYEFYNFYKSSVKITDAL